MSEPAELAFITQSVLGEIRQEERIAGLSRGRKIYVLRGLAPMDLVEAVAHESRHAWQRDHGTFDNNLRENDARIYTHEFTLPLRGTTYDELIRSLTALKPSQPRKAQPIISPSPSREFRGCPNRESRLEYCQTLLQRLPATSEWQKNNLREEIAKLKKEMTIP